MEEYITKKEFTALEKRVKKIERAFGADANTGTKKVRRVESSSEFLRKKDLKTAMDAVICIVYFIENGSDEDVGVTSSDIEQGLRKARQIVPKNISDCLAKCAKKGLIQESGDDKREGKKVWVLTNTGIEYVENLDKEE